MGCLKHTMMRNQLIKSVFRLTDIIINKLIVINVVFSNVIFLTVSKYLTNLLNCFIKSIYLQNYYPFSFKTFFNDVFVCVFPFPPLTWKYSLFLFGVSYKNSGLFLLLPKRLDTRVILFYSFDPVSLTNKNFQVDYYMVLHP